MNTSSQSPELRARVRAARAALWHYRAETQQCDHPTDWLSLARRLAVELDGLLDLLDDDGDDDDDTYPEPGVLYRGGGWISGPSITPRDPS